MRADDRYKNDERRPRTGWRMVFASYAAETFPRNNRL